MKNETAKEHIISVTTDLIEKCNGDTACITARMIAKEAGVGLGLINYHFGSKDNLITECVQRIIYSVVNEFQMKGEFETDQERLTACVIQVFEFLFEHPAISRISILGDYHEYTSKCNSMRTQKGFLSLLKAEKKADNAARIFMLTAAIQVAFLGQETVLVTQNYNLTKKKDRKAYITMLVKLLFEGGNE